MTIDRRLTLVAAVAAATALAPAVPARAGEESGLSLGARVGYGIPLGDAMAGVSLGDVVSGQVSVQLDADWRFDRSWRLGLYAQYGFATLAAASCPAGATCSGQNVRFGVQTAYAFAAGDSRPWVGAGLGVEWQAASVSQAGVDNELRLFGLSAKLEKTPGGINAPPPRLSAHTKDILGNLGYSQEDIKRFKEARVI